MLLWGGRCGHQPSNQTTKPATSLMKPDETRFCLCHTDLVPCRLPASCLRDHCLIVMRLVVRGPFQKHPTNSLTNTDKLLHWPASGERVFHDPYLFLASNPPRSFHLSLCSRSLIISRSLGPKLLSKEFVWSLSISTSFSYARTGIECTYVFLVGISRRNQF